MPHSDVVVHNGGMKAGGDMDHRLILDVHPLADPHVVHIAPHYGAEPEGAVITDLHIPDQTSRVSDKNAGAQCGLHPVVGDEARVLHKQAER